MAFRKSLTVTPAKLAANRSNAQKSTGPRSEAGKRRASRNSLRHGFYATLDSQRWKALETLSDEPEKLARLQQELVAAWQPVNAMQALVVADLAELYWKKFRLENQMLTNRLEEKKLDETYPPSEGYARPEPMWTPCSANWNLVIRLEASLDEEIAAKVKLLIQLQSFSPPSEPEEDESMADQEADQAAPAETEINQLDQPGNPPTNEESQERSH